ncbi:hypothetical protein H1R20_g10090, partial [Candolleomyces eurysporus]
MLWILNKILSILFFASKHPGDSWRLKSLVVWVWAMDTVHKCLIMTGTYKDIVSGRAMSPTTLPSSLHTSLCSDGHF